MLESKKKLNCVLDEPPDGPSGEITDKGSINQRAVLERRANLVEELYTDPPSARVLCLERTTERTRT